MTDEHLSGESPLPQFMSRRERREYEQAQEQARRARGIRSAADGQSSQGENNLSHSVEDASEQPTTDSSEDDVLISGRYNAGQNEDLGDLYPLPEDTRDYPDLASEVALYSPEEPAEDETQESLLGYMLVADGSETAP